MPFFFNKHPSISYDLLKNSQPKTIQNPLVRYRLQEVLKDKAALYYTHDLQDGQSVQYIAQRYYGDSTLDWVIYIVNDIIDPQYDLPLEYQEFINFIKGKYGSVESAMNGLHHYEQIIQSQSVRFDGTILPEKYITVDATTYAGLSATEKREVSNFTYEERVNESKRTIKILQKDYLNQFLNNAESIFD